MNRFALVFSMVIIILIVSSTFNKKDEAIKNIQGALTNQVNQHTVDSLFLRFSRLEINSLANEYIDGGQVLLCTILYLL